MLQRLFAFKGLLCDCFSFFKNINRVSYLPLCRVLWPRNPISRLTCCDIKFAKKFVSLKKGTIDFWCTF